MACFIVNKKTTGIHINRYIRPDVPGVNAVFLNNQMRVTVIDMDERFRSVNFSQGDFYLDFGRCCCRW